MSDSCRVHSAAQQKFFVAKVADKFVEKVDSAPTWMALQVPTLDTAPIGVFAYVGYAS